MDNDRPGELYIVSTPIGNLEDITFRAVRVLNEADIIAAEDTRVTRGLLSRYGIPTPMISYHAHNAQEKAPLLISRMKEGQSVALVSDAGTPPSLGPRRSSRPLGRGRRYRGPAGSRTLRTFVRTRRIGA